ncbi:MAG: immunoglobulin-like domain-containing protein [Candidatus Izemoplasmatales bacterium]
MKLFLKKFAFLGFVSLFLLGLVGCNPTTSEEATDLEKVQAVLASIDLGDVSAVVADLTLPAPTTDGVTVTWSSSNTAFVSNSGVITVPTLVQGDQEVVLTVTATLNDASETKTFTVTVSAEAATAFFTRVGAKVIIDGSDQITEGFTLPGTVDGATITWASSNTDVVSISTEVNGDGNYVVTVTRPNADDGGVNTSVTLTGTITYGDASGTVTKSIRVLAEEGSTKVTTIAEGMALGVGEYVTYQGMTVFGVGTNGFFFTDGTDIMYAYGASLVSQVVVGNVYDVTGSLKYYYFAPELDVNGSNVVKVAPSTAAAVDYPTTAATVAQVLDGRSIPAANGDVAYTMFTVTAKVYVGAELSSGYDVYLVPADYDTSVTLDLTATPALRIYYQGNIDAVRAVAGQVVSLDFMLFGYHTTHTDWYGFFFGTTNDITVAFASDADAVAAALNGLVVPSEVLEATTIDFPASVFGVTLTYASDNETVINPTTGAVDLTGLTAQATVTITVTATKGDVTDTKTFTVKVGETPVTDIATAIANVNNTVKFQGIVTQLNGNNAYVQDETGAVYLYLGSIATYADILVVGNKVEVEGKMVNYNDLMEVSPVANITLVSTGNTLPANVTVVGSDLTTLLASVSKLVDISGLYVKTAPSVPTTVASYTVYLTDGTTELQLRIDKYAVDYAAINTLVSSFVVGQPVSFTGIAVGVYKGTPQLLWQTQDEITTTAPTDAQKVDFDAFQIPATLVLEGDYTFPTLAYATVTAAVSTELAANVTATATGLTFVAPEGTDVVGTVTFTLTLGDVTKDVVVNVTAKAITDAQKLAYDVANLVVPTTASEYDTVTLPVVGPKGSAVAWALNTGNAVLTDGSLAIGYSGAAFDVTLTATFTLGSEVAQTKDFTIAVSAITVVTDFSTIPAMTDGVALYVQGTVAAIGGSYDGTWLQDAAGNGFFLYGYFGSTLGDQILVSGTLGSYHSAKQMVKTATLKLTVSTGNTYTYFPLTADEIVALTGDNGGKLVTFTGLEVYSASSSSYVFKVTGTSANVYLKTYITDFVPWVYQLYQVGDILPAATFAIYNVETSQIDNSVQFKVGAFVLEATDAQMVQAAINAQSFAATITSDTTLTLPAAAYGVTITWASNNETVINSTTGAVDITNLTATTDVTLTGTFVYGTETLTHDFVISCVADTSTDVLAYETGFEVADGFTATTTYNNTTPNTLGPVDHQWSVLSGTPSTTGPLAGSISLQGRDYVSDSVIPTFITLFSVTDVTRVVFTANNSASGYNVEVSYSSDGTTWGNAQVFTLSTTATEYTYTINATGSVYIKFTQVVPTTTVDKAKLTIDTVKIYQAPQS